MSRDNTVITNNENKSNNFENKSNKQIEEMAKIIVNGCREGNCEECKYSEDVLYPDCVSLFTADTLYTAGYRKSTDLAEEIFAEIENINAHGDGYYEYWKDWLAKLAELKNKYIGKDTNVTTNTEN